MDIAILNYPTGELDVLRNIDPDFVSTFFDDDMELYLEDRGYNIHDIHYMCTDELVINEII
jgi:ubiquinone biosynthesis protein Coq4